MNTCVRCAKNKATKGLLGRDYCDPCFANDSAIMVEAQKSPVPDFMARRFARRARTVRVLDLP